MKAKFLYILLVLVLLMTTIYGCAPSKTPEPTQPVIPATQAPPTQGEAGSTLEAWGASIRSKFGGTQLKVAACAHPSLEAFKKMTPGFEALTGIKVTWDEMEFSVLSDKLMMDASAPSTDYGGVFIFAEIMPSLVQLNYVEPLDNWLNDPTKTPQWFNNEDILSAYREMFEFGGKHYSVPFAGETVFLLYRKDLFDKYGVKVPKTMDELLKAAEFFNGKEEGLYGVSLRAEQGWEFTYTWSVLIFPFGGMMVDPATGKPKLNSPETVQSLEYYRKLASYGPPGIESFGNEEAWNAFEQGKVAIMVDANAAAPEVENPEKSKVVGKVGYAPMPAGPAGAYSGVWGWGFSIPTTSKSKEAFWALVTYMTSQAMQEEYIKNGGVASRTSYLNDPSQQAIHPDYQATLETLAQAADLLKKGLGCVVKVPQWNALSEMIGTEGPKYFTGQVTAQQACDSMQSQAEDILK